METHGQISAWLAVSLLGLTGLSGCSTIVNGETQEVTLLTPGAYDARCTLHNEEFSYRMITGETRHIPRSDKEMTVDCFAPGFREKTISVESAIDHAVTYNALHGGIPGVILDHASDALYVYPSQIVVSFRDSGGAKYPMPKYHNPDVPHPDDLAIPHTGPDTPSVQSDKAESQPVLRKKSWAL